jgi:hypothetical protein
MISVCGASAVRELKIQGLGCGGGALQSHKLRIRDTRLGQFRGLAADES